MVPARTPLTERLAPRPGTRLASSRTLRLATVQTPGGDEAGAHGAASGPARPALGPEEVSGREFSVVRKGYDRGEVRAFLEEVASDLAAASALVSELERLAARAAVGAGEASWALVEAVAAEAWRDEVLADLDRRRRELNGEVVRLRAGRDRLRDDLAEAAGDLAEQLRRLDGSLQAARSAGDLAEQRVRAEAPPSAEEQRAELEAARLAGFVPLGAPVADADPDQAAGAAAAEVGGDLAEDPGTVELFARLRAERSG
ncbi:MAG: DivIVA domain-containing protein [Acidimicrobiia bacterium]|nr:DivIVA domain-containing protein [Acidimicrobiia bacterium]MYB25741.1 DivIVA domain-containing protein [Acidimicrobiia bacterium]MYJ13104.1 DivIVA domain-containing protein [Acidimicrobiia bacterium]